MRGAPPRDERVTDGVVNNVEKLQDHQLWKINEAVSQELKKRMDPATESSE